MFFTFFPFRECNELLSIRGDTFFLIGDYFFKINIFFIFTSHDRAKTSLVGRYLTGRKRAMTELKFIRLVVF